MQKICDSLWLAHHVINNPTLNTNWGKKILGMVSRNLLLFGFAVFTILSGLTIINSGFSEINYKVVFGQTYKDKNIGNKSKDALNNGDKKICNHNV